MEKEVSLAVVGIADAPTGVARPSTHSTGAVIVVSIQCRGANWIPRVRTLIVDPDAGIRSKRKEGFDPGWTEDEECRGQRIGLCGARQYHGRRAGGLGRLAGSWIQHVSQFSVPFAKGTSPNG